MKRRITSFWMILILIGCLLIITAGCTANPEEGLTGSNSESNHTENSTSSEPQFKTPVDIQMLPDDKIVLGNPLRITPWPELIEQAKRSEEEKNALVTGLFETAMDLTQDGGGVKLDFTLKNISESDLSFGFDVGREYDIFVTNSSGEEIYRRSHGKEISVPAISNYNLKKGEKLSFSDEWNYNDNYGIRVPSGEYSITVEFKPRFEPGKNLSRDELSDNKLIKVPKK